ncbi:Protein of uncharacterised function (DUF1541) [Aedoeadaptatus ivorii]|uniref:Protein of uncharacterized function (DUF1541) n=1 Tax=Aedoeadaptatus ivorii TaxID=54006 RepID=A0A448UZR3_9FIRM|nr:YdhK family protein [Peptoniphilus ivorii]VEJ34495.1 Protein of uncharacterised function (DUF1541) [Peptoniphilus ivorii]
MRYKKILTATALSAALVLTACNADAPEAKDDENANTANVTETAAENQPVKDNDAATDPAVEDDHGDMAHDASGEVPEGLKEAENPAYPVGTDIVSSADHMKGMEGAKGTVVGAYHSYVYEVSYRSTIDNAPVKNHKWVVHEEIEGAGDAPYQAGDEVTLTAKHMEGMEGAKATVDAVEESDVYMVDLTMPDGSTMRNHKWVTESELQKKE